MNHKASILGTFISGFFAFLSHAAQHFEAHASTYAAFAAVVASMFTIANIVWGWVRKQRRKARDEETTT